MAGRTIPVKPELFQALQNVDIKTLGEFSETELRPVLPCLVRTALCAPVDGSEQWARFRKDVLKILAGVEVVNSIVALLSIDFHALEQDVKSEQQLRAKLGSSHGDSVLVSQMTSGLALEFEHSDPAKRIRLLLSELLFILSQLRDPKNDVAQKTYELFECEVYLEEVSDVLCIAQAELPTLLPIKDVAEALMYVPNGPWLLCHLVANSPDCFKEVCRSLVTKGEKQDEEAIAGRKRLELLQVLCEMNPKEALFVRSLCIQNYTMPGLSVALTLTIGKKNSESVSQGDTTNDLVAFVTGLLLGNSVEVRNWFSQFIKAGQKRKKEAGTSMLQLMRQELLEQLTAVLPETGDTIEQGRVIQASSFIRLYCALKGMATLRFSDEEMTLLLQLVTLRPPPSQTGSRFISLGLCMLIACPYLLGNPEQEKKVTDWIRWLMASEEVFERKAGKNSSFGEMLFLIAIHFHGNHMHAIAELACTTLGMKSAVKANALSRIRQIFTQEIFTEQVITSYAVTVPVTENLNVNMSGYLAIHCIYQLLKSRAFSKYKVPIKDWIYRQIRSASYPLHPLLPSVIEVYVNSIIVKSARTDYTNEPIASSDLAAIYSDSVFVRTPDKSIGREVNLAPQLCALYYVLLYEDTIDSQRKNLVLAGRSVDSYPETLMAEIPINYLVQEAQKKQHMYGGLFSSILRLLVTKYPHLCIIEDWLEETVKDAETPIKGDKSHSLVSPCTPESLKEALGKLAESPIQSLVILENMLKLPIEELLPFSDDVVNALPLVLSSEAPRKVVNLVKRVWFKLHSLTPRSLRLVTVNALRPMTRSKFKVSAYTETDITVDPLIVLRGDDRIFRCAPILEIVLRVLGAYTQACRVYMESHIQSNPVLDGNNQLEQERQDLKNALITAQESAVIQILLECCLPKHGQQETEGLLSNLREVQCVICSYIHQTFISDPNLAKLIHFQGYPSELLALTVAGIPSMHICLDYIPEMLSQPQLEKQVFAIKLMSHLCCQYALPKSLSIAKLCINVMFTMVGVLAATERVKFFLETLPCLVRVCQAFPPLCEDVTTLLLQIGRVCLAHISAMSNVPQSDFTLEKYNDPTDVCLYQPASKKLKTDVKPQVESLTVEYHRLYKVIQTTFSCIVRKSVATRDVYTT